MMGREEQLAQCACAFPCHTNLELEFCSLGSLLKEARASERSRCVCFYGEEVEVR